MGIGSGVNYLGQFNLESELLEISISHIKIIDGSLDDVGCRGGRQNG